MTEAFQNLNMTNSITSNNIDLQKTRNLKKKKAIPSITTGMGPMTDKMINDLLNNCNNNIVKDLISNKLIDPITEIINRKTQPYIHFGIGLYVTVIILLCIIIYLQIVKK